MISAYIPHIVWNTGSWNLPVRRAFATFPKPKFHALRSRLSRNLGNIVYLSQKLSPRFRRAFRYLSRLRQHMHFEKRKVALCCNRFSEPPRPSVHLPAIQTLMAAVPPAQYPHSRYRVKRQGSAGCPPGAIAVSFLQKQILIIFDTCFNSPGLTFETQLSKSKLVEKKLHSSTWENHG